MTRLQKERIRLLGVMQIKDAFGATHYRCVTNTGFAAPKIIKEYFEGRGAARVRYYKCEPLPGLKTPRIFIADTYDKMFTPAAKAGR